jgi:hypothetical protein
MLPKRYPCVARRIRASVSSTSADICSRTRQYATRFHFLHHFSCCVPFVLRVHLLHHVTLHLLRCAAAQYASFTPSRALLCPVIFLSTTPSSVIGSSRYETRQPLFCRCCGAMPREFSTMLLTAQITWVKNNVLGSGLSVCETNSARQGFILWGVSQSPAPARRRTQRRTRYGRDSVWKGHSLASRGRRARQNPHPRAVRLVAEKAPRIRRRKNHRIARRSESSPLESVEQAAQNQETI